MLSLPSLAQVRKSADPTSAKVGPGPQPARSGWAACRRT